MNALEKARELIRKKKYLDTLEVLRDAAVANRQALARTGASDKQIIRANIRTNQLLVEITKQRDAIFALEEALGIPHGKLPEE